jgi:S1-C subfamily serine protease
MAAGLERPRVAELIVDRGLPGARRGSGYLVSSAVVLTAAHVVRDAGSVMVRFNAELDDEWTSDATVTFADPASDIGVVRLASPAADPVAPVGFGALGERAAVLPYSAVGFRGSSCVPSGRRTMVGLLSGIGMRRT